MPEETYVDKMPDLNFTYDNVFYPFDEDLPDPQVNPIIKGKRVPINKVGIAPVDLPVSVPKRDGTIQTLQAKASLYCSLDKGDTKGLNLSRLYLVMHDTVKDHLTLEGIKLALENMAFKQGSKHAYCKLRFRYPWTQEALRSRVEFNNDIAMSGQYTTLYHRDGMIEPLANQKMAGHIAYDVEIEGRYNAESERQFKFFLTITYVYSSTCPCSFELAYQARRERNVAANAHSQRSTAKVTIEFDPEKIVWIEDLVELCRTAIPTEVQVVVKRRDEQAFAELNGANLLFSEDAARLLYGALDDWYEQGRIFDFCVVISHEESLHPFSAICVIYKGVEGGLR